MTAARGTRGDPFGHWCDRWGLRPDGDPILTSGASLLPVRRRGTPAMLKVAHDPEERFGAALMAWWNGAGAAPVLAHEGDALLMARAMGTRSLAAMSASGQDGDDEACRILCTAIAVLHAPRREPRLDAIPLETWFAALLEGHGRYGGITTACADAAHRLLAEQREPVPLHGDVHHGNVLDFGERGWLAIDPKRLLGERGFDYANLVRNGDVGGPDRAAERLARRLAVIGGIAGLDRHRLLDWTMAFTGLSSVWRREDGDPAEDDLLVVRLCAAEIERG